MNGPSRRRRFVRALLLLLPPRVRRERGRRLEEDYEAMWAADVGGRRMSRAAFWWGLVRDVGATAAVEWATGPTNGERGRGGIMSGWVGDVRWAMRQVVRQPLFSGTVIALVAIGIAANTAVFRVVNGLFLRPLPFVEADRLVDVDLTAPEWNLDFVSVSIGEYRFWEEARPRSFESMAVFRPGGGNLAFPDGAERVSLLAATHTLDDVLEVRPVLGRFFVEEEDRPDAALVGVLTHGFWTSRFASDPEVVGTTLPLDGQEVEVIGVLPPEAELLGEADLWVPLREDDHSSFYLTGIGRLSAGATPATAQAELRAIRVDGVEEGRLVEATNPVVASLRDRYLGERRLGTGLVFGAVAIVLLIACANIAGLMMARAAARESEVAVRRALGAGRGRLVRQLLAECIVLAGLGGLAGALIGFRASDPVLAVVAEDSPPWVRFDPDPSLLVFVVLVTCGVAFLFGVFPALRASAPASGTRTRTTAGRSRRRKLRILVGAEVALAVVLLVAAGLALVDVRGLQEVDPGFDPEGLLTWQVQPGFLQYPETADLVTLVDDYRRRLEEIPGVEAAVVANVLPLSGHSGWFFEVEGAPVAGEGGAAEVVLRRNVTPGYIDAMGVTLLQGRTLSDLDGRDGSSVAIVNEAFVRSHVPAGVDPLGLRIRTGDGSPWIEIVGVSADVHHYGMDTPMRPAIYEPFAANPSQFLRVAVRARGIDTFDAVRRATLEVDPGLALFDVRTMQDRLDQDLLGRRAASWLFTLFAAVSVLLCAAGLYGVISYGVGQRRREIGIRLALGAESGSVGRRVAGEGLVIAGVGVGVGLVLAALAGSLARATLVSAAPWDARVYAVVTLGVLLVATLANWVPARRAAGTSPAESLRVEG